MSVRPIRLRIDNAAEDVPRLVTGWGKHPSGGEFGLVLRPTEQRGVLVSVRDQVGVWRADASDAPRGRGDAEDLDSAVAEVRALQKNLPPRGPITLRGQWTGELDPRTGSVTLRRKIATYGVLTITSDPTRGLWEGTVARDPRWFAIGRTAEFGHKGDATTLRTLDAAIRHGLGVVHDVVGQACAARDTTRRGAVDTEYAKTRPVREAKVRAKDPVDRLGRTRRKKKAAEPKPARAPKAPRAAKAPRKAPKATPGTTVVPARTAADRAVDAAHGELIVTPLRELVNAPACGCDDKPARAPRARKPKAAARPPAAPAANSDELLLGMFKDALASLPDDVLRGAA